MFPLFCKKLCLLCGKPIYVDKNADDNEIERIRKQVEDELKMLQDEVHKISRNISKTANHIKILKVI